MDECDEETDDCAFGVECTNEDPDFVCGGCDVRFESGGGGCVNVDECSAGTDDCDALASCADEVGSFFCQCGAGSVDTGLGLGTSCATIDECAILGSGYVEETSTTSRYLYVSSVARWAPARDACVALGGTLWTVDDSAEQSFVLTNVVPAGTAVWTGLHDQHEEAFFDGSAFIWQSGSLSTHRNFGAGQPIGSFNSTDCTSVEADGSWIARQCANSLAYVCEFEPLTDCGAGEICVDATPGYSCDPAP